MILVGLPLAGLLFLLLKPMRLLDACMCELIAGGAPVVGNISTTVNTTVGGPTVNADTNVVVKPKVSTTTKVANQLNVSAQTIAFGGVNSSLDATQINKQRNGLTL